jgi:hypothetical protein
MTSPQPAFKGDRMNPQLNAQPLQLSQHCMHAGGWEKLGWQTQGVELDDDTDVSGQDDGDTAR